MPNTAVRPTRLAVVAPPYFPVPPPAYGGIEAVVALLVDGLAERGHDVTLVGAGEQRTKGGFRATFDQPLEHRLGDVLAELSHTLRVDDVLAELEPQVVHDHTVAGLVAAGSRPAPMVVTWHGPVTDDWGEFLSSASRRVALVAISHSQIRLAPHLPWHGVVHNAIDAEPIPFQAEKDEALVWFGRLSPDKAAHLAIDVARAAGRRIRLAGRCRQPEERDYFDRMVAPRLGPDAEWLGELDAEQKYRFLGAGAALLFPLQWDEPFGMVLLEAMACGTPVLSLSRGAVPEVVADGRTGFVRDRAEELVEAIGRLDRIDPAACRAHVLDCFGADRMVAGYERVYAEVLAG